MAYLSRKKAPYPSRAPGLAGGVRALGGLAWAALPMLLIASAAGLGAGRLWQLALNDPAFAVGGQTQDFGGAAGECPEARLELSRLGGVVEGRSLFDPGLDGDLRRAYEQSSWIREVQSIRRVFPNRLEIVYRLRVPVAQAHSDRLYWLLDVEGHLLPAEGSRWPAAGLPVIDEGTRGALGTRPAAGKLWSARGVQDALGLMLTLWGSELAEVASPARVTVFSGSFEDGAGQPRERRPRLQVSTTSGRSIRWGTFNAGDLPDEQTSAQKLWRLKAMLEREPTVPDGVSTRVPIIDISTSAPLFAIPDETPVFG